MTPEVDTRHPTSASGADGGLDVQVEELARWRRRVRLVVPPERVRRERERILRDYGRRLRLPGFRPGKAPADLVRRRFGDEIDRELARALVREGIREAVEGRGLKPITAPVVQALELDRMDTLRATAELEIQPDITLSRLSGFRLERQSPSVPPGAVERVLQRLRDERAELRPIDRPAARGDVVVADVEPLDASGGGAKGYAFLVGAGQAPPEVDARLEGARPGDEREVTLEPRTALDPAAGLSQPVSEPDTPSARRFRLRVHQVSERILPALDDAFAASVSRAATLEELRARIADDLRREAEGRSESDLRDRLIQAVAEANAVEVPESMVTRAVERMLEPPPDRAGATEAGTDDELARILRPAAERSVRRLLVIEAIARDQGVDATDAEVDAYLGERLEPGTTLEEARRQLARSGRLEDLRFHLRMEKVFAFLKKQSDIREPQGSTAEPRS